ncbi:hypothetical protein RND81_12G127400 [Saponaria officinalis]|uniref:Cellulose synthase-like protein G2 n=1 Tax=Saponaria officinalis TaxID=3572 RepID=A0AAW1H9S1_SAPOF
MENYSHIKPLQTSHVLKLRAIFNKIYSFSQFIAINAIFYYRVPYFFNKNDPKYNMVHLLPWVAIFIGEIFATFMWVLRQPAFWWPVTRATFPDRLPKDKELPKIDVFICTADPKREPTIDVMNTVISAMALDYPSAKLSVYLSDDGGALVTLNGLRECWIFATWWLPFVKRYNVKTICPRAYFEKGDEPSQNMVFLEDRKLVKEKYERFEKRAREMMSKEEVSSDTKKSPSNHPAIVQMINESNSEAVNPEQTDMPLLVYIAREKNPSHPHNFKAGALNVLIRVSSTMSNAPYILVLDCDMYCNGSSSARQAMCFHLDPSLSSSLGWVQFPHKFHNIAEPDIYDSQMRTTWPVLYPGLDGLQGPVLSGTNFYIKRQPLYGVEYSDDMKKLKSFLGSSNELIKSLTQINMLHSSTKDKESPHVLLQEAHFLASCTYERDTKWGEKVGFRYKSVVEDVMTGLALQSQGWKSVFLNPKTPEFLGSATTNLNDLLTQGSRWCAGLLQIGLSEFNPLFNTSSQMTILEKMTSSWITLFPLDFFHVLCFAVFPPVCFFYDIPLYPKVLDPLFIPFAYIFISSNVKHLLEVILISKGTMNSWMNERRISMIKGVTCYVYGALECVMSKMGIREANFIPTNKAGEEDKTKLYQLGKYDFRSPNILLVPLVTLVTLNMLCFVGGIARVIFTRNLDIMFAQVLFSLYVLVMSSPIVDGMLLRKDDGRVPLSTSLMSAMLCTVLLGLGYVII